MDPQSASGWTHHSHSVSAVTSSGVITLTGHAIICAGHLVRSPRVPKGRSEGTSRLGCHISAESEPQHMTHSLMVSASTTGAGRRTRSSVVLGTSPSSSLPPVASFVFLMEVKITGFGRGGSGMGKGEGKEGNSEEG